MTNFPSNEQGPLWTPTVTVERLMLACKAQDTIEISAKVLEGLLFDTLQWRKERIEGRASSVETSAKSYTVEEAWRIALTLANNLCVQESDRLNRDDGPPEAMHALGEAARRIRDWMEPGEKLAELLAEGTGRMPGVAAETTAPTERALVDLLIEARRSWIRDEQWVGGQENGSMQPTGEALRAFGKRIDVAVAPYRMLAQLCGASKTGVHVPKPDGVCVFCGSSQKATGDADGR